MAGHDQLLGGYWFLKSLFTCSFIGYATIKYVNNIKIGGGILLVLTIITSYYNISIRYLAVGDRELFAALFFVFGYGYKKGNYNVHNCWWIIPLGLSLVTLGEMFWSCNLLLFNYKQVIPFLFSAVAGLLMVFKVSALINLKDCQIKKLFVYIGNNTLTIFTWHFLSFKIVSLMIIVINRLSIERLAEFPVIEQYSVQGWFFLYFIIGIIVPLAFTRIKILK